jgi:hypothetical protein
LPTSDEGGSEQRIDRMRRYLHDRGMRADDVEEACAIARKHYGEQTEDALPVSGSGHAALPRNTGSVIKRDREPGEKVMPSAADAAAHFREMFPEAARVGVGSEYSQFAAAAESSRPMTPRDRQLALDSAQPPAKSDKKRLQELFGKSAARRLLSIKTGLFDGRT